VIAVNAGTTSAKLTLNQSDLKPQSKLLYGSADIQWVDQHLELHLPGRSGCVLG